LQWFTAKLVMLLFREKLFLTLLLGMSYTWKVEPEGIIRFFSVVLPSFSYATNITCWLDGGQLRTKYQAGRTFP
jgi:hypothetical protein